MITQAMLLLATTLTPYDVFDLMEFQGEPVTICVTNDLTQDEECERFDASDTFVTFSGPKKTVGQGSGAEGSSGESGSVVKDILNGLGGKVGAGATVQVTVKSEHKSADGATSKTETSVTVKIGVGSAASGATGGNE